MRRYYEVRIKILGSKNKDITTGEIDINSNSVKTNLEKKLLDQSEHYFDDLINNNIRKDNEYYDENSGQLDTNIQKAKENLIDIRNKAIQSGQLKYDESGNFLYAIAPNGKKSNLPELQRITTRSDNFLNYFGDREPMSNELLLHGYKGMNAGISIQTEIAIKKNICRVNVLYNNTYRCHTYHMNNA